MSPPKKYFDLYPRDQIKVPTIPEGYLDSIPEPAKKSITRKKQNHLPDDLARQAIQAYYASITFADAQVGRILDSLEQTGLDKNTIVVFTSDHGYHMGEHDHYQKTTLFENATHVPLIIAGPGVSATGQSTKSFAEMVDFYPTLAELSGLEAPEFLAGVSLVPALNDVSVTPRESAFTQYSSGYSVRTDRYRYTEWGEDGAAGIELYDHTTDPEELNNLASSNAHAEAIRQHSEILHARIAAHKQPPTGLKQNIFDNKRKVPQR